MFFQGFQNNIANIARRGTKQEASQIQRDSVVGCYIVVKLVGEVLDVVAHLPRVRPLLPNLVLHSGIHLHDQSCKCIIKNCFKLVKWCFTEVLLLF